MDRKRVEAGEKSNLLDKLDDIRAGLLYNFHHSGGFKRHLAADVLAIALGIWFSVGEVYMLYILFLAIAKISAECFNSSDENLSDKSFGSIEETDFNPPAADTKHSSAAGIGIWVLFSLGIWGYIFLPEFYTLLT